MAPEPSKEYPNDVVRGTFFEHDVPIEHMFVHFRTEPYGYARPLRQWRVNQLIATFERAALGVLLLSMRNDGSYAILDGHHRMQAAKHHGLASLDAFVYIDLTLEQEAHLYRKFGEYLKQTALDRYHAGVAERMPEYLGIQRVLTSLGLHVPQTLGPSYTGVVAVDALIRVATVYGLPILTDSLALLQKAFQPEARAYRGMCINGTAAFLARFQTNPDYRENRLIQRLAREGISKIERQAGTIKEANMASNPNAAWGMALLKLHDKHPCPKPLGDWPTRHYTEQAIKSLAANLKRVQDAMTPEQKSENAKRAARNMGAAALSAKALQASNTRRGYSVRAVACPHCMAAAGDPCQSSGYATMTTYHAKRKVAAKEHANGNVKA